MYSSIFVYFVVTIININNYSTGSPLADYISYLMSLNLILYLQAVLGKMFKSAGVLVGATLGGAFTISGLFARNYILNLSQQNMSTLQIIFIYLLLQLIFTSYESILMYFNIILLPMARNISLPYIVLPMYTFIQDLTLVIDIIASFGEVMSVIYVLMATGMWSEM